MSKDSFFIAAKDVSVYKFQKLGTGFLEKVSLQKLEGDGMAFVHSGGYVVEKCTTWRNFKIDTGCIVAFLKRFLTIFSLLELKIPFCNSGRFILCTITKIRKKFGFRRFLSADWQTEFYNMQIILVRRRKCLENWKYARWRRILIFLLVSK